MLEKRVVALDVGEKRIGVAVSDPMGWTAQGLESYIRKNPEADIAHFVELMKAYEPFTLLFGMPRNMNGSYGPQAEKIAAYAKELSAQLSGKLAFEVDFFDERLTSMAAERILIDAGVRREKRRKVIDKMAAVQILQGYLDSGRNGMGGLDALPFAESGEETGQ